MSRWAIFWIVALGASIVLLAWNEWLHRRKKTRERENLISIGEAMTKRFEETQEKGTTTGELFKRRPKPNGD